MKNKHTRALAAFFKIAAFALAFAPATRAATFDFSGDGTDSNNIAIKQAIGDYAISPNSAAYATLLEKILIARDAGSSVLPTNFINFPDAVTVPLSFTGAQAGSVHLRYGASLTFSGLTNALSFQGNSLGAFTADVDARYIFSGNATNSLSLNGGTVVLANATFSQNTGISITAAGSSKLILSDAVFSKNNATVINTSNSTLVLSDVVFSENKQSSIQPNGGNSTIVLTNAIFSSNASGAIYTDQGSGNVFKITNATLSGHAVATGAAYFWGDTVATFTNANFIGNSASASSMGGATTNSTTGVLTFRNTTFTGNASPNLGAAIYNNGTLTLVNAIFAGNISSTYGDGGWGGAVFSFIANTTLEVTAGGTSLFTGNALVSGRNRSLLINRGTWAISTIGGTDDVAAGVLDMRDPFSFYDPSSNSFSKTGTGIWKLGGANAFTSGRLTVAAGVLYLYRAGEVDNPLSVAIDATVEAGVLTGNMDYSRFSLGLDAEHPATLAAGGVNAITASGITLNANSTLAFNPAYLETGSASAAGLTLKAYSTSFFTIGSGLKIDLLSLNNSAGTYNLVKGGDFTGKLASATPTVRGEAIEGTRAAALGLSLSTANGGNGTANSVSLTQTGSFTKASVVWTGDASGTWNIRDANWTGDSFTQFLHGDDVTFGDGGVTGGKVVRVNAGGVLAGAVTVTSDDTYIFNGGEITGETLSKSGTGTLVLNQRGTYSGTIAFTGGAVQVNGALEGKHVTVGSGVTVGGTGARISSLTGTFTLGAGATLAPEGLGYAISARSVVLEGGSKLVFDLDEANSGVAVLLLNGGLSTGVTVGAGVQIDLQSLSFGMRGSYQLISGGDFSANAPVISVRGEVLTGSVISEVVSLTDLTQGVRLVFSPPTPANMVWTGVNTEKWNVLDDNWSGRLSNRFWHGDTTTFDDTGTEKVVSVNAGGVLVADVVVENAGEAYTFEGGSIIARSLTKNADGKLVLAGKNTYTNGVEINSGTLLVNDFLKGDVVVNGGMLGGSGGTIDGTVVVEEGGTLSPGASIGELSVTGNVTLAAGATLFLELDTSNGVENATFDVLQFLATGKQLVVYGETLVEVGVNGVLKTGDTFQVIGGLSAELVSQELSFDSGKYSFTLDTSGLLTVTGVPEPSTYALFGAIGAVALALVRRRKNKK